MAVNVKDFRINSLNIKPGKVELSDAGKMNIKLNHNNIGHKYNIQVWVENSIKNNTGTDVASHVCEALFEVTLLEGELFTEGSLDDTAEILSGIAKTLTDQNRVILYHLLSPDADYSNTNLLDYYTNEEVKKMILPFLRNYLAQYPSAAQ